MISTRMIRVLLAAAGAAGALAANAACSTTFNPKTCTTDGDCGEGLACVTREGARTCVAASDAPIRIGQSAAATGPSRDLGLEMRRGIELAFNAQNAAGGIRGRPLELVFRDDQYTPDLAEQNARQLVDAQPSPTPPRCPSTKTPPVAGQPAFSETALLPGPNAVTAVIGSVGTPTMVRSAPIIVEAQRIYFGAFTGAAAMLRDTAAGDCAKYIFNVRASYGQEARATLEYFFSQRVPDDSHLISFDQNDSFGDAGYNGLVAAYKALRQVEPDIRRYRYTRDVVDSVPAQATAVTNRLREILAADGEPHVVGILMTDTYGPGSQFIKLVKDWQFANDAEQGTLNKATRLTVIFSNVSFVGPNSLAERLRDLGTLNTPNGAKPYTENVLVSQVVPNYQRDNSNGVLEYRKLIEPTGAPPTFTSFEGYIAGRVFIEGLKASRGSVEPDELVAAFESLAALDIGIGGFVGFSKESHQASKSVWGTTINSDGSFTDRYFWSDGSRIQLSE